jgi:hypothetical protein
MDLLIPASLARTLTEPVIQRSSPSATRLRSLAPTGAGSRHRTRRQAGRTPCGQDDQGAAARRHGTSPIPLQACRQPAQIGKHRAVIDFGWCRLRGAPAWWIWGIAHIYFPIAHETAITGGLSDGGLPCRRSVIVALIARVVWDIREYC